MTDCIYKVNMILFYLLELFELTSIVLYAILIKTTFDVNTEMTYEDKELIKTVNCYFFTLLFNLLLGILLYSCGINAITKHDLRIYVFSISIASQLISILVIVLNSCFNFNWTKDDNTTTELITICITIIKCGVYLINVIICFFVRNSFSKLNKKKNIPINDELNKKTYDAILDQGQSHNNNNTTLFFNQEQERQSYDTNTISTI